MISDSEVLNSQSLHYTVKAFLFSASLKVQIQKAGELKRAQISSRFKFPPPFGPQRTFEMVWAYSLGEVAIEEKWDGKSREATVARAADKLDLVQLFWGSAAHSIERGLLLWRQEDVQFRSFEMQDRSFSFDLERKGSKVATVEGQLGPDGLLKKMKLSLNLPLKLGAITVERNPD